MDFRSPSNPFPFAREHLRRDESALTRGERKEIKALVSRTEKSLQWLQHLLGANAQRGEIFAEIETLAGLLDRAGQALMTQHQREREEAGRV